MALTRPRPAGTSLPLSRGAAAAGLFALAFGLFLPTLGYDWVNYDDDLYITGNVEIARGLTRSSVAWAFTSFHGANWFPLTRLSWLLDHELFGFDAAGYHATNALLHATATCLLFLALARMTQQPGRSAFVAAVFAVHPLHVESVAWAAARKDTLSGVFWMLALWLYARDDWPAGRRRLAVWGCTLCALMAKPTAVTLPFVLLLLDVWPLRRLHRGGWSIARQVQRAFAEKAELFATVGVVCIVVVIAQTGGGAVAPLDRLGFGARIANALVSYATYVWMTFWPTGLAVLYPHLGSTLPVWQPLVAAAILAAVTLGVLASERRAVAVGWFWFLGTLVPTIGIVQVGSQAMADRYMYLPLVGLAIAVTWGSFDLARGRQTLLRGVAIASICVIALVSLVQLRHWRNSEALFTHALRVTTGNHIAHAHLGAALLQEGKTAQAIDHYLESMRLRPDSANVANNLAWLLATTRNPELRNAYLALRLAERAASLTGRANPQILDTLAAAYAASGRFDEALATAQESIDLARAQGLAELAQIVEERLDAYRAQKPWIQ